MTDRLYPNISNVVEPFLRIAREGQAFRRRWQASGMSLSRIVLTQNCPHAVY